MLDITIKYGEITITECKEDKSYDRTPTIVSLRKTPSEIMHKLPISGGIDTTQNPTYKQYILYLKQK